MPAATQYTVRQPAAWARSPDTVRESRMPRSSPVMTRAITRPAFGWFGEVGREWHQDLSAY